jgi:hypothetical protein
MGGAIELPRKGFLPPLGAPASQQRPSSVVAARPTEKPQKQLLEKTESNVLIQPFPFIAINLRLVDFTLIYP